MKTMDEKKRLRVCTPCKPINRFFQAWVAICRTNMVQ